MNRPARSRFFGALLLATLPACRPTGTPVAVLPNGEPIPAAHVEPLCKTPSGQQVWIAKAAGHLPAISVGPPAVLWRLRPGPDSSDPGLVVGWLEASCLGGADQGAGLLRWNLSHDAAPADGVTAHGATADGITADGITANGITADATTADFGAQLLLEALSVAEPRLIQGASRSSFAHAFETLQREGTSPLWNQCLEFAGGRTRTPTPPGELWVELEGEGRLVPSSRARGPVPPGKVLVHSPERVLVLPERAGGLALRLNGDPRGELLVADGRGCVQRRLEHGREFAWVEGVQPGPVAVAQVEASSGGDLEIHLLRDLEASAVGPVFGILPPADEGPGSVLEVDLRRVSLPKEPVGLTLVLEDQGSLQVRRPALRGRWPAPRGGTLEVRGLDDGLWSVQLQADEPGWMLEGETTLSFRSSARASFQPTGEVLPGWTLDVAQAAAWPVRGAHLLTLFRAGEQVEMSLDFRPEGHVVWNRQVPVPEGRWWAWLRPRAAAAGPCVAFGAIEVAGPEPLHFEASAPLRLVEAGSPNGAPRPTGRPLVLLDGAGQPIGTHTGLVPVRTPGGDFRLEGLSAEMRLLDPSTGRIVLDRGRPASGYRLD